MQHHFEAVNWSVCQHAWLMNRHEELASELRWHLPESASKGHAYVASFTSNAPALSICGITCNFDLTSH